MVSKRTPKPTVRKKVGIKEPLKRVVVVAEGAKTEPQYFTLIRPRCRAALIEVEIIDEPATDPRSLVRRACELKSNSEKEYRKTRDPNSLIDGVWCVFDVDEHHYLLEASTQARDNGIQLAISNPSFEVWLLLHFQEQTAYVERDAATKSVQRYLKGYNKKLASLDPLANLFEVAKARAIALEKKHVGDATRFPDDNPSSGVWRLVDAIHGAY